MINNIIQCRYGRMLYNSNDICVGRSLEMEGEWYQSEMDLLARFIQPADVIIDVGANIGCHTLFFAAAVGLRGLVIAFEPQLHSFQLLCANVALNDLFNVVTYNAAVGQRPGVIPVPVLDPRLPNNFAALSLNGKIGRPTQVVPLDALILDRCRLIKIDVEGMELDVVKGAQDLISKTRPTLYCESKNTEGSRQLIASIRDLGYEVYEHLAPGWNPSNFRGNKSNAIHGDYRERNILCLSAGTPLELDLPRL